MSCLLCLLCGGLRFVLLLEPLTFLRLFYEWHELAVLGETTQQLDNEGHIVVTSTNILRLLCLSSPQFRLQGDIE